MVQTRAVMYIGRVFVGNVIGAAFVCITPRSPLPFPGHDLPNTYDQPGDDAGEGNTDPPPLETPCVCMAAVATNKGMCMHGKLSNARGQVNSVLFLFTVTSACVGCCLTYRAQEGRKRPPSLCERGSRVGV